MTRAMQWHMGWALMLLGTLAGGWAQGADTPWYLQQAGMSNGVCVVLTQGGMQPAIEVAAQTGFLVHALDGDAAALASIQSALRDHKWTLERFVSELWTAKTLPHADGTIDLVLAFVPETPELRAEAERVLRPGGKAAFGLPAESPFIVKPTPEGLGDWPMWEHGPDNNPVSTDTVIKAPYGTQWMGGPYYNTMPAITTMANGRIFTAMGHIAHHEREEAWLNTLLARNGYNGQELWRKKLPDGYMVHRSAFIATDNVFYMIDPLGEGCTLLDPETGQEKGRIRTPEVPGLWKWMALDNGVLYVMTGKNTDPAETTSVRSLVPAWSWGELSAGYYSDRIPWGFGETLLAYSLESGKVLWTHQEDPGAIDSRGIVMGGGKLFFYAPDKRVGCLDTATGKAAWINEDPETRALIEEKGKGLSSTPGFRSCAIGLYTPEVLVYQGQTQQNVVALSTSDGKLLWHRPKTSSNPNAIYLDGRILVGIGNDGSTLALEPKTGKTIEDLGFKKRSCARLTATSDSLFVRGFPEGITRYDRKSGKITFDGAMRPACNDGIIGANGLLYVGPWPCDCGLALIGTAGLCPVKPFKPTPLKERITPGTALPPSGTDNPGDWTAHRGGTGHTGSSTAELAARLFPIWTTTPEHAFLPTTPIAAGGKFFVAGDDGIVRAFDGATGAPAWTYATAGPVLVAPTYDQGRIYAGSGDGNVYCLDANSGALLWRFQAAPTERRIMLYGRLCSNWPVHTGVAVKDGVAYFAAGLIDTDGTSVYAVDAVTGAPKWCNDETGHLDKDLRKGVSAQGILTLVGDTLWLSGGNIMGPSPFDLKTGQYTGNKSPGTGVPRTNRGEELGVFGGEYLLTGGHLRYSAAEDVVSPAMFEIVVKDGVGRDVGRSAVIPAWDDTDFVYLANREAAPALCGTGDLKTSIQEKQHDRKVPAKWTAQGFEGRLTTGLALGGRFVAATYAWQPPRTRAWNYTVGLLDRSTGLLAAKQELPGPARMNGMAIDREGRLIVALEDGRVVSFAGEKAFGAYLKQVSAEIQSGKRDRDSGVKDLRGLMAGVHDAAGQQQIAEALTSIGYDLYGEAKKNGAVRSWQLAGPIPYDAEKHPLDETSIGEPNIDLSKPAQAAGKAYPWSEHRTMDKDGKLDLAAVLGDQTNVATYAYAEVTLREAGDLLVKVGSNDGCKVWFNGKPLGKDESPRGYRADQDAYKVSAMAGKNTLLVKVVQYGGAWAVGARITRPDDSPVDFDQP